MLGERGLWLKKTFFEQALRVPLIIHAPGRFKPGRVREFASLLDLLPTCASLGSDGAWDGAVEPLDGEDLTPYLEAGTAAPERTVYAELLCEGILAPIFMIRRGRFKFLTSKGDPDQLFDLEADPDELVNLADEAEHADLVAELRREADEKWDSDALAADIRLSQKRRLFVRRAHAQGAKPAWDHLPASGDDPNWYRGDENYNDWAFSYLPDERKRD